MQQVLAYETDLLEYPDLLDGSKVIEERTSSLMDEAWSELSEVLDLGGAFEAIDELKSRLVRSEVGRTRRIESGELPVVGVNRWTTTEPSPLGGAETILRVDPSVEAALIDDVEQWRKDRDKAAVQRAVDQLRRAAESGDNVMPATVALAHAGGTTGEWAGALREVFGEYRAPTGVGGAVGLRGDDMAEVTAKVQSLARRMGGPPKLLVAKPGLDGHSNGAEQIAVAARDAGFEVVYQGIRSTPAQIAATARDEDVDVVGLSILSGSHLELVPEVIRQLRAVGVTAPVVVGGIIPEEDAAKLREEGVAGIYTPKDFQLVRIMSDLADLVLTHGDIRT
jgi:(2R)-ethylmalonyl-CoA mutase